MSLPDIIKANQNELTYLIQISDKLKELQGHSFGSIQRMLRGSKFYENKDLLFQFLCCLNSIANSRPIQLPLYCKFLKSIIPNIKDKFTSDELVIIFTNKRMLLLLLKEKLVNIQTIINFFVDSADILQYFCEELQSADKNWFETQKGFYPILDKFLKKFKKEEHRENRNICQNEDLFARTIRKDDAEKLQELIAFTNRSFSLPIGSSPYEMCDEYVKNSKMIEYAAYFGSVKSFKYLWMNGAAGFSVNLPRYAISGGNYDIIHITEQLHTQYDEDCLNEAIRFHRNDIVHYLIDSIGLKFTLEALLESIKSFNFEIFNEFAADVLKDVNQQLNSGVSALHIAAQYGNLQVVKLLVQIPELKPNIRDQNGRTPLHLASRAGYMSIVKCLVKYTKVNIESKDKLSNVPLHLASLFCRLEVVKFLSTLQRINPNVADRIQN